MYSGTSFRFNERHASIENIEDIRDCVFTSCFRQLARCGSDPLLTAALPVVLFELNNNLLFGKSGN